jgi:hypothetical protein
VLRELSLFAVGQRRFQESGRGKTGGVKDGEGRNPVTLHQENDPAIAGDDLGERAGESVENTAVGDL